MSKYKWRQRKQKRKERAEKEAKRLRKLAPFVVIAQQGCGCCDSVMHFKSKENADAAFKALGLTCGGVIVDDLGECHQFIDTFYGYRRPEEARRSIDYLMSKLVRPS